MLSIALGVALGIALAPAMYRVVRWCWWFLGMTGWSILHPSQNNGFGALIWLLVWIAVGWLYNTLTASNAPSHSVP